MPIKTFAGGEEALAADVNTYLMAQAVATFPNASARSSAVPAPVKGQVTARDDAPGVLEMWDGSAWIGVGNLWVNYTPTWSNNGTGATQPSLGNGTLAGHYSLIGPKTCAVHIGLTIGSTTNAGRMNFVFALPVSGVSADRNVLSCYGLSAGRYFAGFAAVVGAFAYPYLPNSTTTPQASQARDADSTGAVGTGIPLNTGALSFPAGSQINITGVFQVA